MEMNFCRRCGSSLNLTSGNAYQCTNGHFIYANSSPCVGIFLIDKQGKVILSVRGIEPHKGMLDTLGGFVDSEETFEQAIQRELKEEIGLEPSDYTAPIFLTSAISHYPYKGEDIIIISSAFWAKLTTDKPLKPADDVASLLIDNVENIDTNQLHDDGIKAAFSDLRNLLQR